MIKRWVLVAALLASIGARAWAASCTGPCLVVSATVLSRLGIQEPVPCQCSGETPTNANWQYIDAHVCADDVACNVTLPAYSFGTLPASPAAAHELVACTNCAATNPCTSGSSPGTIAHWTGSAWNCGVAGGATLTGSETLTNKTLTTPIINSPTINSATMTGNYALDGAVFNTSGSTGLFLSNSSSQKLGAFGATPVVQPTSTTDLRTALINLGWYASGGATPLNLNGGAFTTTGTATIGTSGAAITRTLTGSATLDFASAAAGACSADLTITVTNAADGDPVMFGTPNGSVPAGSLFHAWVSAAGTVTVRHCCIAGTCDPASGTFKVRVVQ